MTARPPERIFLTSLELFTVLDALDDAHHLQGQYEFLRRLLRGHLRPQTARVRAPRRAAGGARAGSDAPVRKDAEAVPRKRERGLSDHVRFYEPTVAQRELMAACDQRLKEAHLALQQASDAPAREQAGRSYATPARR